MSHYTDYPATMPMPLYTDSSGDEWIPRMPPDVEPVDVDSLIDEDMGKHREASRFLCALVLVAMLAFVVITMTGCGGGGDICDEKPAPVECRVIPDKAR